MWALPASAQRQTEHLGRGLIALRSSTTQAYIGWRLLGNDPSDITFNLYRAANAGVPVKVNGSPLTNTTDYLDTPANLSTTAYTYSIVPVRNGVEVPDDWANPLGQSAMTLAANASQRQYFPVTLQPTPDGVYRVGFVWVGDLNGDGEYDYVMVRQNPSVANQRQWVEAYLRDGTFLWRMNLGFNSTNHYNIEPGSSTIGIGHGDNMTVYDMDGDGKAEVVIRTANGVEFADASTVVAANNNSQFISIVDGMTGVEKARAPMPNPFLSDGPFNGHMGIFYADGVRPSVVLGGKNRRSSDNGFQGGITAWDYRNGQITQRWSWFDQNYYAPEGHQIRLGDVDHDGKDEWVDIGYALKSSGTPLYNLPETVHGDRFHMTDIDPDRPGLETFLIQQDNASGLGTALVDAATGKAIKKWYAGSVVDVGRGVAGDFSTARKGLEMFSTMANTFDAKGNVLYTARPFPPECIWWDGDLLREFCATVGSTSESPAIEEFNPADPANKSRLFTIYNEPNAPTGSYWHYGGRPPHFGDLFGDWREEVIVVANDNSEIRIYTTKNTTSTRLYTLQHNAQYRLQQTTKGYYQASYVDYYLGDGMTPPPPAPFSNAKLVWRGGGANDWDAGLTANWFTNNLWVSNTTPVTFNGESVLFDSTGSNHTAINLTGSLTPAEATVYSPKNFTFGGSGSLDGAMKLTKVGAGRLVLSGTNNFTGSTLVAEGALLVNGSLPSSPVTVRGGVWLDGRLGGSGIVGAAVTLEVGAGFAPGQGTNSPGTLALGNNVTLGTLALHDFDLSDDPTGTVKTNDLVTVAGNVTLQGTNTFVIRKLDATLPPGVYPLINYSGTFSGNLNQLLVSGLEGIPVTFTNLPGQLALVVKNVRAPATITWTGGAGGNVWDLATTSNWLNGVTKDIFVPQDTVRFDNIGTSNLTVNFIGSLLASNVIVDSTANYTFSGGGAIIGAGSLMKSNTGTLTINTANNAYTGRTVIAGGTVAVSELDAIGFPSPLGNQSSTSPTNLVLSGNATLRVANESYTDRGLTLGAGTNIIEVNGSQLTIAGTIPGAGALRKAGTGNLALSTSNSYSGGTIISAGTIVLGGSGGTGNRYGVGTGPVTFTNGTLSYLDLQSSLTYTHNFVVPPGCTGRINCDGRSTMTGTLTGSGTFSVWTPYVRTDLNGNWSAFTGQINVITDSDGGSFRINNSAGLPNARVNLAASTSLQNRVSSSTPTISIGELSGAQGGSISGGTGNDGLDVNWSVGGLNTSVTFAGNTFDNVGFIKVGTGNWTLSGTNLTHTGPTTVNAGTLLYNGNGTNSTSAITVGVSGTLGGNGIIGGNTVVNGKLAPGAAAGSALGTLTLRGTVTFGASGSAVMEIQKSNGAKDLADVGGTLTYGGTLVVSNLAGTLVSGDSFKIFNAPVYAGAFAAFNLPGLNGGLAWDTSALLTTGTISVVPDNVTNPPAAPGGLSATAISSSQINLAWTDNATNESSFLIERSTNNISYAQIASVGADVTSYPNTGLATSTLYYYRVRASNNAGNSDYSNVASATTLAPAASLVWRGDGAGNVWDVGITANWSASGSPATFANGAGTIFDDSGSNNVPITVSGTPQPASITFNATKNYTIGGTGLIGGSGALTKSGMGTITFTNSGNNTFSGGVTIGGGILALGTDSGNPANQNQFSLGTGTVTVNSGGQLRFGGRAGNNTQAYFITNAITLNGGTIFSVDSDQHLTNSIVHVEPGGGTLLARWLGKDLFIDSRLTGSGPLSFDFGGGASGPGAVLYLSNPLNTYSGTLTILTNAVHLTTPFALSNAVLEVQGIGTSANLVWSGITSITLGGLSGAGNITLGSNQLQVGNNNLSTAYSGTLLGAGSLVKLGTGTLTLSGANTYSGLTTISNGVLQIGDGGNSGTLGTNNVIVYGTLAFNRANALTYNSVISGPGQFQQRGDGIVTLSGINTYTGATIIDSGTLALTGNGSIASSVNITLAIGSTLDVSARTGGTMTLASGKVLRGIGAVNGNFVVGIGALLQPGASLGSLTFSNNLTLAAGGITTLEISSGPVAHDQVRVLGSLGYGGTLVVTNIGVNPLAAGDRFQLFNAASPSGSFSSVVLPALGPQLAWDTSSLYVNGTIVVVSTAPPEFGMIQPLGDGNFQLTFTGPTGADYELRATTNLMVSPITLWDLLDTGTFGVGAMTFDDLSATNYPQRFYQLRLP